MSELDMTPPQPAGGAGALLDQRRLSLALRSGAGLLFAVAFFWPTLTFAGLVMLFSAYAFFDGILMLSAGGWSRAQRSIWPLLLGGCADIAAAAAAYCWPGLGLVGLGNLMAGWALALAGTFSTASFTLREEDPDYLLLLGGIAAALFGRALLSQLAGDAVVLSTWTGLYALSIGIVLLKLALQRCRPLAVDLSF